MRYTVVTNGYRFAGDDDADQTNVFSGTNISTYRPNIKLTTSYVPPAPAIEVAPANIAYGTVRINTSSANSFQISNPGTATLSGTITTPTGYTVALSRQGEALSDGRASLNSNKQDGRNSLAYSIPAGSSSTFSVSFTPTAVQAYNGNITITHNAGGADKTIALTGQGGKPTLALSASSFTANLALNGTGSDNLGLSNTGNMQLSYNLAIAGSVPWLSLNGGTSASGTIAVGGAAQNVSLSYNAAGLAAGTYNATINGSSNDPTQLTFPIQINLTVTEPNHAPVLSLPESFSLNQNGSLTVDFSPYISDPDGDVPILSYSGNSNIGVSLDGYSVTFTPIADWYGSEEISFTVSDGDLEASDIVSVNVNQVISHLDTPVLQISSDLNGISISWQPVDYATEYQVYRSGEPNGVYSLLGSTSSTQYLDNNPPQRAFYYVKAVYNPLSK